MSVRGIGRLRAAPPPTSDAPAPAPAPAIATEPAGDTIVTEGGDRIIVEPS